MHLSPISTLLMATTLLHLVQSNRTVKQCFTDIVPISFPSLQDYQGSHYSFDKSHPTFRGNAVRFEFTTIDKLLRNSFISFDSDSIISLDLRNKRIQEIQEGAFNSLFCLHFLYLTGNNVSVLTENVFEGLGNLKELDLSGNSLSHLDGLVFRQLNTLTFLNLSKNELKELRGLEFTNLTSLLKLDLSQNKIRNVSPNVFSFLKVLSDLNLNGNQLYEIEPEKWTGLRSLKLLNLADNYLDRFDTSYNFSFFGLQDLNLSGNYLRYLNPYGLTKNLPQLHTLDVRGNDWLCSNLDLLKQQLADTKTKLYGLPNCSTTGEYRPRTESTTTPSTSTVATTTRRSPEYQSQIFVQNGEILFTNKKMLEKVGYLENVIVCLFVIVIIFVVVEIAVRIGFCHSLYNRMTGRNRGYLDGSDTEHLVLMGR